MFLSPHYDDIAFSLGNTVREIGRGTLVNLFTRSINLPNPAMAKARVWTIDEISAQRDAEDARFAEACGLDRRALGLKEPPVRGRHAKDLRGLAEDREQVRAPLTRLLVTLGKDVDGRPVLFCPAAIGGHVNHLATMYTVAGMLPDLRARYRVFFYEDLPYGSSFWRRRRGLARLARTVGGLGARHVIPLGSHLAEKMRLVAMYESQHRHEPRPRRYSPGALGQPPHEAFWELAE